MFFVGTVDSDHFSAVTREALLTLLDDTSPAVHRALLEEFAAHSSESEPFLREVAAGKHRALAWHARRYLEELKFSDTVAEFRTCIRYLNYELETGSLMLARTVRPDLDSGHCCEQVDTIAARCRELIVEPSSAREKCRVLNRVLFHDCGFHGNVEQYTDPLNSYLDQVLHRRKGIPISLSIVYLLVAQRVGLELEPVGLPGHFMVGCFLDAEPFFIDAFDGGIFRSADEILGLLRSHELDPSPLDLAPTPIREVLCRSCRNLVQHYTAVGDEKQARLFAGFVSEFESTYERNTT